MSKEFKLRSVDLAQLAMEEMDKLPDTEARKMFVGWLMNFWGNATQDLASYAIATGEIKPIAEKSLKQKFKVAREVANK